MEHWTTVCALVAASLLLAACGQGARATIAKASAGDSTSSSAASKVSATDATQSADPTLEPLPGTVVKGGGIELFPQASLVRAAGELAHGSTTARTFASYPTFHYVQARRSRNGSPEIHDEWIDVTIVQSGRASLLTGGRVEGSHLTSPGEHRGGNIVDGRAQQLTAGDLVTIPAGIPHQYRLAPGDTIRYLTIKIRRPPGA